MKKRHLGMTLVEVIVAIALLGVITVSFLMMYTSSYSYIFSAGRKTNAVSAAEKNMESSLAVGTASTASTLSINFGGTLIAVNGEMVSQTQTYDNGSRSIAVSSFVPLNSVASGTPDVTIEPKLEVYANEKTLKIGDTFEIQTNKPATFSVKDSIADVATVNASTGIVTAMMLGTEVVKVTPVSTTYPTDFQEVTIIVTNEKQLMDVKGGEYVRYAGVTYQKLTGLNGRVLALNVSGSPIVWTSSLSAPSKEELSGDVWTEDKRKLANAYWTITPEAGNNPKTGQFVNTSGAFATGQNQNDTKYLRVASTLDQYLRVVSGTGAYSDPYELSN